MGFDISAKRALEDKTEKTLSKKCKIDHSNTNGCSAESSACEDQESMFSSHEFQCKIKEALLNNGGKISFKKLRRLVCLNLLHNDSYIDPIMKFLVYFNLFNLKALLDLLL